MKNKFNKEDSLKAVKFLNFIAKKAKFNLDTQEVIDYYKLLSWAQTELVPKIDANILEVIAMHKPEKKKGKNK